MIRDVRSDFDFLDRPVSKGYIDSVAREIDGLDADELWEIAKLFEVPMVYAAWLPERTL